MGVFSHDGSGQLRSAALPLPIRGTRRASRTGAFRAMEAMLRMPRYESTRTGLVAQETDSKGRTRFSEAFMKRLEKSLGKDVFKRGDFDLDEHGCVMSGKPLTRRRISAIMNRVAEIARTTEEAKTDQDLYMRFTFERDIYLNRHPGEKVKVFELVEQQVNALKEIESAVRNRNRKVDTYGGSAFNRLVDSLAIVEA